MGGLSGVICFSEMGRIRRILRFQRFLDRLWRGTVRLFDPIAWRFHYAALCYSSLLKKKNTGGLIYESFEG